MSIEILPTQSAVRLELVEIYAHILQRLVLWHDRGDELAAAHATLITTPALTVAGEYSCMD